jgi:hypothetical protein
MTTGGAINIGHSMSYQIGLDDTLTYTIQVFGALLARGFIFDLDINGFVVLSGIDQWSPGGLTVNNQEWVLTGFNPGAFGITSGIATMTFTAVGWNPGLFPPPPQPGDDGNLSYIAIWPEPGP